MEMPVAAVAALRAWTTRSTDAMIRNRVWIRMLATLLVLLLLAMWLHHGTSRQLNGEAGVCTEAAWMEAREVGRQEAERKASVAKSVQVEFEQLLLWALCSLLALAVNALFLYEAEPSLSADPLMTVKLCLVTAGVMILLTILKCRQKWHSPALFANLLLISATAYFIWCGSDPLTKMRGPNQIDEQVEKVISVGLLIAGCLILPGLIHGIVMSAWRGGSDSQWLVIVTTLIVTSGVWVAVTLLCTKHLHNAESREKEAELVAKDADNASLRADLQDKEAKLAAMDSDNADLRAELQDKEAKLAAKDSDNADLGAELQDRKAKLAAKDEVNAVLCADLQDKEAKLAAKDSDNANLRDDLQDKEATLVAKDTDNANLREDLKDRNDKIGKLCEELDSTKVALKEEKDEKKVLARELSAQIEENNRLFAELKTSQKMAGEQEVLMQKYHDTLVETNFKLNEVLTNHPEEPAELAKLKEKLEDRKIVLDLEQHRIKQQVKQTKDSRVGSSKLLDFLGQWTSGWGKS